MKIPTLDNDGAFSWVEFEGITLYFYHRVMYAFKLGDELGIIACVSRVPDQRMQNRLIKEIKKLQSKHYVIQTTGDDFQKEFDHYMKHQMN